MAEIKILKKHNPDNYTAIIFTNKTHYIFDMIEPAKEIIEQILSFGVKCKAYYADLTANDIDFFDQVANDFTDLSILINNASIFDKTKYLDMLANNYEQCFNIHVKNPLFLSQKFAKIINGKIIINISDALAEKIDTKLFIHAFSKNATVCATIDPLDGNHSLRKDFILSKGIQYSTYRKMDSSRAN
jgi:NAD(P)-dependent dehydrogenase (short-subunit alcohol dehydrogenase family)